MIKLIEQSNIERRICVYFTETKFYHENGQRIGYGH